jgi:hypothetical protein
MSITAVIECAFLQSWWHISGMHAEAVKLGARPSKFGLMSDAHRSMNCEECDVRYCLHYDSDAEGSVTHWSLVAKEVIMAHHPHHTDIVFLDRSDKF